jgi:hypothetical protein
MAAAPEQVQRFRPTNGRITGLVGVGLCVFVAVVLAVSSPAHIAVPGVVACAFVAVLIWLAMLRPGVWATESDLHLRTLFETVSIPLASIETVVVRRYLLVRSGGRKYICPAISRSLRKTVGSEMKWRPQQMFSPSGALERYTEGSSLAPKADPGSQDLPYADFVEQRIWQLAVAERGRRGIEERSEQEYELGSEVDRRTAWPELTLLAALAVAFVVTLLVL